MLRPLLLFLCLLFCPGLVWAQDDFCGRVQSVHHACPMHAGQDCQCHEHELCYRIALEKPDPKAPAPARFELVCPPLTEIVFRRLAADRVEWAIPPPTRFLGPSLAPEPPPPRDESSILPSHRRSCAFYSNWIHSGENHASSNATSGGRPAPPAI